MNNDPHDAGNGASNDESTPRRSRSRSPPRQRAREGVHDPAIERAFHAVYSMMFPFNRRASQNSDITAGDSDRTTEMTDSATSSSSMSASAAAPPRANPNSDTVVDAGQHVNGADGPAGRVPHGSSDYDDMPELHSIDDSSDDESDGSDDEDIRMGSLDSEEEIEAEAELLRGLLTTAAQRETVTHPPHRVTVEDDPEELPLPEAPGVSEPSNTPEVRIGSRRTRQTSEEDRHEGPSQSNNGTPFATAHSSPISTPSRSGTPLNTSTAGVHPSRPIRPLPRNPFLPHQFGMPGIGTGAPFMDGNTPFRQMLSNIFSLPFMQSQPAPNAQAAQTNPSASQDGPNSASQGGQGSQESSAPDADASANANAPNFARMFGENEQAPRRDFNQTFPWGDVNFRVYGNNDTQMGEGAMPAFVTDFINNIGGIVNHQAEGVAANPQQSQPTAQQNRSNAQQSQPDAQQNHPDAQQNQPNAQQNQQQTGGGAERRGPGAAGFFDFMNLIMSQAMGQQQAEDPKRARRLVAGLEPVPEGLIKRMQRVGGTGGLHEDASGGSNDVQCSVCWDSLLDAEREGFGSEAPAQQQSDAVEAQSEQQTEATASTTSNAPSESSDAGVSNANGPTPSPAQGIYLFYRSSPVDR